MKRRIITTLTFILLFFMLTSCGNTYRGIVTIYLPNGAEESYIASCYVGSNPDRNTVYIDNDENVKIIIKDIPYKFVGYLNGYNKYKDQMVIYTNDEEGFSQLLKEDFRKTSGTVPDDSVIDEAITWWKSKVIFSRPLRSDDEKAWKMIKQYVNSKLTYK